MHNQTVSDSIKINDKQPRTATAAVVRLAIWKSEVHRAISTGSSLNMSASAVWPMFIPATEKDPPMLDTISPAIVIHGRMTARCIRSAAVGRKSAHLRPQESDSPATIGVRRKPPRKFKLIIAPDHSSTLTCC